MAVRSVKILEDNFSSRVNTMLHDVFEDSDRSESEDIDDSDADPDFVLPNDKVSEDAVSMADIESEDNYDADPDSESEVSKGGIGSTSKRRWAIFT